MEESEVLQPQISEEQRKKILIYLQQLYTGLKELIEETRSALKQNDDDFDHITVCLTQFKEKSTLLLVDLSIKNFGEQIKLEE